MFRATRHSPVVPSLSRMEARAWPRDALLKRRRSVLFAFTFSPPAGPR